MMNNNVLKSIGIGAAFGAAAAGVVLATGIPLLVATPIAGALAGAALAYVNNKPPAAPTDGPK